MLAGSLDCHGYPQRPDTVKWHDNSLSCPAGREEVSWIAIWPFISAPDTRIVDKDPGIYIIFRHTERSLGFGTNCGEHAKLSVTLDVRALDVVRRVFKFYV